MPLRPRHEAPDGRPAARPWAVASAVVAPVAMIGGWLLAEALAPGFDPVRRTISELATADVPHPGVMTAGLLVTGAAHVVTASGLPGVPRAGRLVLALGGVATAAVGLLPLHRTPTAHGVAAAVAFGALALWPAASARRGARGVLRPAAAVPASALLLGLLAWFVAQAAADGAVKGLAERAVAGGESLAPLALVLALGLGGRVVAPPRRVVTRPGATGGLRG